MEEQEFSELDIFAAIALIGVQTRASSMDTPEEIAKKSYAIAEAMIVEHKKRKNESDN